MGSLKDIGKANFTEKWNLYLDIYEDLWRNLQHEPIRLLEQGVYNGNSLRTWCDWFTKAEIIGFDKYGHHKGDLKRAKFYTGDQSNKEFIKNLIDEYKTFDIIIDDAGHIWNEQQLAFQYLWPAISPGGMYIIEDLQTSTIDNYYWGGPLHITTVRYLEVLAGRVILQETDIKKIEFYSKLAVIHKVT